MEKNWDYAARLVWPLLTDCARRHETITYGEIAPVIQTNPLNVGRALGPLQDFCLNTRLPPLTSIVVNTHGVPGGGFIAWDIDDLPAAHRIVFEYDWSTVPNPYGAFGPDDSEESLAEDIFNDPTKAEDVLAIVKVRGVGQQVFKRLLLKAYEHQCAFCGLTFGAALEGCHIVPWSECSRPQRLSPQNGLLLCANHHSMFDAKLITVSRSFKIVYYDVRMNDTPYSRIDKRISVKLHGQRILLPKNRQHWPSIDCLASRHERDEWGDLP